MTYRDDLDAAQPLARVVRDEPSDDERGDRAEDEAEREVPARIALAGGGPREPEGHPPHVAPEIDEHREQRAEMHGEIERDALVAPTGQDAHHDGMTGRGDGQKLGQPPDH